MPITETTKVGKRGTIVIPAKIRKLLGIGEGDLVIVEERDEGVLIRKAMAVPIEKYSPRRKAEFMLSNAVNKKDYARAVREVKKMGIDPETIPHHKTGKN